MRLTLNSDVEPILRPPKRLPIELKEPVKLELDRLDNAGVLTPVDEPTDWVNQMAIATKKNGSQRICIDPRSLNLTLENLSLLLERCRQKSVKLNRDKVVLRVQQVDFMGHLLTAQGLKPDPNKVEAILKLETPRTKEKIERLNGTVNYLAKFLPRLSQVMEPLRRLTQRGVEWYWGNAEEKAFDEVKQLSLKLQFLPTTAQTRNLPYSAMPVA